MYPYPQRPGAPGAQPSTSAFATAAQQPNAQQPFVPPPPPAAPGIALYSASSGSVTTLRLKPSDSYVQEPPVRVSPALLAAARPDSLPGGGQGVDLALERGLVEEVQGRVEAEAYVAGMQDGELPLDPAVKAAVGSGASLGAAMLGAAYGRAGRGGADKASDFASKVDQLTGMGFPLALAAGALGRAAGDVEAATETCLAVTG